MRKAIAIFLSALLFISSTGFTVSNHFCGGSLEKIDIGFSGEKLVCEMTKVKDVCPSHPSSSEMEKASCCSNQFFHISLEDTFEKVNVKEKDFNQDFFIAYSLVREGYASIILERNYNLLHYTPPLLDRDIPVLVQSFLI